MPQTVTRRRALFTLLAALLLTIIALAHNNGAGWRWLVQGGWHSSARMGALTPEEQRWAQVAWRYFSNNTQPGTGLINGSDNRPLASVWQIGDTLIALTAARELKLIDEVEFDQRLTRIIGTLNRLPLSGSGLPNRLYNTRNNTMVDYSNQPKSIGWSSQDIARLLMALRIVAVRYPAYSEYLERAVLRWNFCRIVDDQGQLYAGLLQNGQLITRQEGRLGDSEYSAAGFGLWGFANQLSLRPPSQHVIIYGMALDIDARDPRTTWTPTAITTMPYALSGLEYGWDLPGAGRETGKLMRQRASMVYQAQEQRWQREKILTARSDFTLSVAPWHVNDTLFANGYAWNTLGDDGKYYPRLAQVSTRAVFGLWALWDTEFTDALMRMTRLQYDAQRGWFEGRTEATGDYNRAITLSTNATVLEALLYKANMGPLLPAGQLTDNSYFSQRLSDVFNRPRQCFPQERKTTERPDVP